MFECAASDAGLEADTETMPEHERLEHRARDAVNPAGLHFTDDAPVRTMRRFLAAGLLDELRIGVAAVALDAGERCSRSAISGAMPAGSRYDPRSPGEGAS